MEKAETIRLLQAMDIEDIVVQNALARVDAANEELEAAIRHLNQVLNDQFEHTHGHA